MLPPRSPDATQSRSGVMRPRRDLRDDAAIRRVLSGLAEHDVG